MTGNVTKSCQLELNQLGHLLIQNKNSMILESTWINIEELKLYYEGKMKVGRILAFLRLLPLKMESKRSRRTLIKSNKKSKNLAIIDLFLMLQMDKMNKMGIQLSKQKMERKNLKENQKKKLLKNLKIKLKKLRLITKKRQIKTKQMMMEKVKR